MSIYEIKPWDRVQDVVSHSTQTTVPNTQLTYSDFAFFEA